MAARVHRSLKAVTFIANDSERQDYELSKELQHIHIDVALLSETSLKLHERFYIPNFQLHRTHHYPG
jgi:hypothetical protein